MISPDPADHLVSTPRLRSALETFPPYIPGKPPRRVEGLKPFKLSSNENHLTPLPAVLETMTAHAKDPALYPDDAALALRTELSERLGVDRDELIVTTGASELLVALTQITSDAGTEAIYPWPSFEMYPQITGLAGAKRSEVPLTADGRHDLAAMAAAITDRTSLIILCSPNNPTGPALRDDEVRSFLARVPEHVLVAVDEAYWEFATAEGVVDGLGLVADFPNVVLLRTFSKAHGLAGLRVGYSLSQPEVTASLRKVATTFAVTEMAQTAAIASLDHLEQVQERVQRIVDERERVLARLAELGWDVPQTRANFVWLPLGEDARRFAEACAQQALSVRAFDGDGVRVSIDVPQANDRFLEICSNFQTPARHVVS